VGKTTRTAIEPESSADQASERVEAVTQSAGSVARTPAGEERQRSGPSLRTAAEATFFVLVPIFAPMMIVAYLVGAYHPHPGYVDGIYFPDGGFLFDLHVMWKAGHDVVTGHSPYPFVYPAPAAFLMVPFGALPWKVAVVAYTLVLIGAVVLALRLLRVRDWRCYGAVLACVPLTSSVTIGTLSPLLLLATAAAWRYRDRRLLVALAIVGAVVTKLFLWPLVIWLVATRRIKTAATTVVLGIVAVFGCWALLGFDGLRDYPHRIGRTAGLEQAKSFSPFALARAVGFSTTAAHVFLVLATIAALAAIVLLARGADGDRRSFVAAVVAGLALSPIVWLHYLVIVFAPIAVYRRRLSIAWVLPLVFWLYPGAESGGNVIHILGVLGVAALAVAFAVREPRIRLLRPILGSP
jgi:Glycosyltransferase family 87